MIAKDVIEVYVLNICTRICMAYNKILLKINDLLSRAPKTGRNCNGRDAYEADDKR